MNNRIKKFFQILLVLPILSGCSFFESAVLTCNEPQEYEQSTSIQNLVVPDNLRELQKRSRFNIGELDMKKGVMAEDNAIADSAPMTRHTKNESTQHNITEDELWEHTGVIAHSMYNTYRTSHST